MKKSVEIILACLAILYAAAVTAVYVRDHMATPPAARFGDLAMRASEVACAHEGLDSFLVWDRQVDSPRYAPAPRPDKPHVDPAGRRTVHAYPPWHTTFFWFWGWLSPSGAACVMLAINILLLAGLLWAAVRFCPNVPQIRFWLCVLGAFFLADPIVLGIKQGQYGILLAAATCGLCAALEKKRDVLAGLCWALLMVKPQVGMLFFWPLFFQRRWAAIATAIGTCLVATVWPAWVYGVSPHVLIARMSEIGRPFMLAPSGGAFHFQLAAKLFGAHAVELIAAGGFAVCGVLCWWMRRCSGWWLKTLPVVIFFPFWTYSKVYDNVVSWNFFAVVAWLYAVSTVPGTPGGFRRVLLAGLAFFAGVQFLVAGRLVADLFGFRLPETLVWPCLYAGLIAGYLYWLLAAGCLFWAFVRRLGPFARQEGNDEK